MNISMFCILNVIIFDLLIGFYFSYIVIIIKDVFFGLFSYFLEFKIWDIKDKVLLRVRFDRFKVFRIFVLRGLEDFDLSNGGV